MPRQPDANRADRLLDAAAERFVDFGYDKTSVSEITRAAGVSKGAFYLEFESKDELLEELLLREMARFSLAWAEGVEAHPRGGTVGGMYSIMLRALDESPFMGIIFRRDRGVLGRYLQRPDNFFRTYAAGSPARHEVLALMQQAGAIRADVDVKVAAHLMNLIALGLVRDDDMIPDDEVPPLDELVGGIADFMDRALTPEDAGASDAGKAVIREIMDQGRRRLEELLDERRRQREARRKGGGGS